MTDIQISGFEMQDKLGQGGMATVWKARQLSLDRTVAIKILSAQLTSDPDDVQRFQQESQSAAKLKHPGIVQVYDANIENGLYFFVMEFIAGYTCGDWLKRAGRLSAKDVLLVADCVADALDYAWDREKLVHCDIKPDNIMIDDDGTVKVMDLGLARTIHTMSSDVSEDILGTPSYMAPEQALGEPGLDCRTDMYSLGAMLYHLATGELPFAGCEPEEVMERQIKDVLPNPRDINPSLSKGFCRLVEVMMAKEQTGRPADWQQVREGIRRVRKGLMPGLKLPEGVVSTVAPRDTPDHLASQLAASPGVTKPSHSQTSKIPFIIIGLLLVGVIGVFLLMHSGGGKTPAPVRRTSPSPRTDGAQAVAPQPDQAQQLYDWASAFESQNATQVDDAIKRYQQIISDHSDSPYAARARRAVERLQQTKREQATTAVIASLNSAAEQAIANHDYDAAIQTYEDYAGEFEAETRTTRMARAAEVKVAQSEWNESERVRLEKEKYIRVEALLDEVARACIEGDFSSAVLYVEQAFSDGVISSTDDELNGLVNILKDAAQINNTIMDSFAAQKGQQVTVELTSGAKNLVINNVRDPVVYASMNFDIRGRTASRSENFTLNDLAVSERIKRMGPEDEPHVNLAKGVMAYGLNSFDHARRFFSSSDELIAARLIAFVDNRQHQAATDTMIDTVNKLMRMAGLMPTSEFDAARCVHMVQAAEYAYDQAESIRRAATMFQQENQDLAGYDQVKDVISAMIGVQAARVDAPDRPAPRAPVDLPAVDLPDDIAALVGNPNAVMDRLLRDNRALGSEDVEMRRDNEGRVIRIRIRSNELGDIRALAACRDLREFVFRSRENRETAPLADLSPLAGLPLETVSIEGAKVDDLEPLRGLPLRTLRIPRTNVRDLNQLSGMLLETVDFSDTRVFDFKPLSAMPIKSFSANNSQLRDLGFMRDWQLESLELSDSSVFDFSVLSRMPLKHLNMANTQVRTLDVLRNCPLEYLDINGSRVSDLSPLKNFSATLRELRMGEIPARNFDVLGSLNLERLFMDGSKIDDLGLISHMQLSELDIDNTPVKTLEGLDVSRLTQLYIEGTKIESIEQLNNARELKRLYCRETKIRNFSPIYGSGITHLFVDDAERKESIFRRLPDLETVNWLERFW